MEMSQLSDQDRTAIGQKPEGSEVILKRGTRGLYVEMPKPKLSRGEKIFMKIFSFIYLGLWLGVSMAWCPVSIGIFAVYPSGLSALFVVMALIMTSIFWVIGLREILPSFSTADSKTILHIGRQTYGVWSERCSRKVDIEVTCEEEPDPSRALGETRYLDLAVLIPGQEARTSEGFKPVCQYIEIREGIKTQNIGQGLELIELKWILMEVNQLIKPAGSEETASMV